MRVPSPPAKNRASQKLLALVCGAVLAYGLGEALTRIFVPDPAFRNENRIAMWQRDPLVGYKNQANFRGYAWGFVPVETNPLGFRGGEVSVTKAPNTFRIVGLGDSITWGVGVRDEHTYLRVLEGNLNRALSTTQVRFEIVNTSVVGYSTHQELLTLERDGLPLCPDLVTVGYTPNDFYPTEDPFYNVHTFHQPTKAKVSRFRYPTPGQVRFHFFWFVRSQIKQLWRRLQRNTASAWVQLEVWPEGSFEGRAWPVLQDHFRGMKRLADQHGFRLLIVLFPDYLGVKFSAGRPFPQSRVGEFLASERIDYIDLFDDFRRQRGELFVDWVHLNPAGHRLTAEVIQRYLQNKRWLPEVGSSSVRRCTVQSDPKP